MAAFGNILATYWQHIGSGMAADGIGAGRHGQRNGSEMAADW
jgi:hypothetical protein